MFEIQIFDFVNLGGTCTIGLFIWGIVNTFFYCTFNKGESFLIVCGSCDLVGVLCNQVNLSGIFHSQGHVPYQISYSGFACAGTCIEYSKVKENIRRGKICALRIDGTLVLHWGGGWGECTKSTCNVFYLKANKLWAYLNLGHQLNQSYLLRCIPWGGGGGYSP